MGVVVRFQHLEGYKAAGICAQPHPTTQPHFLTGCQKKPSHVGRLADFSTLKAINPLEYMPKVCRRYFIARRFLKSALWSGGRGVWLVWFQHLEGYFCRPIYAKGMPKVFIARRFLKSAGVVGVAEGCGCVVSAP